MKPNPKLLLQFAAAGAAGAALVAFGAGSHMGFKLTNGSFEYDVRTAFAGNWASALLGLGAMAALIGGIWLHFTEGTAGSAETGPVPSNPTSPSGWLQALRGLSKSYKDKQLDGICGGLGEHTPLPAWVWRMLFLSLVFFFGGGLLLYLMLAICLPRSAEEIAAEAAKAAAKAEAKRARQAAGAGLPGA